MGLRGTVTNENVSFRFRCAKRSPVEFLRGSRISLVVCFQFPRYRPYMDLGCWRRVR